MADAMKRDTRTCLDPETIAAFIDGKLTGPARERVVAHLADCADCYFVFSESARAAASDAEVADGDRGFRVIGGWLNRRRVVWSSVAGLAAAAAFVVAVIGPWRVSPTRDLQALVAAVGTDRTFEPRLSGGFAYGPLKVTRGTPSDTLPEVRIAAAQIEKAANEHRSPINLDALGIAYLVTGRPGEAVTALENATRDRAGEAAYWSDLSAAYLMRAQQERALDDLIKAMNAADHATRLDPTRHEAWFNRALAIEQTNGLREEAKKAWEDYLRVDTRSEWASEARSHLARLSSQSGADWRHGRERGPGAVPAT